ncbi:acyl-CoA Delta-9 desaturase-like [Argiope bruennichi]|uniref:acyl-CoA Delta-9 desaturase-like n=1 Tax=Argiope bruennichi TaxID=94029 RepID=UPI0024941970|nr:acyl-CoA Delta-9 desaturase-like [Argiope bruennichi]XP_055944088.1 acyl-CoA Delta-9 desaturase-like [Argiope bruennichi]
MAVNLTTSEKFYSEKDSEKQEYKIKIVWFNVVFYIYLHAASIYALYLAVTSASWKTVLFAFIYASCGELGITAGSHRLWCHRSYKAKWPLRALLCCFASIAAQNDIYEWCRDHRVHHKFTDTNADPHNIKRGFFFAHIGWLMCKKHPDVAKRGKSLHLGDLWADPIVRFHRRFYVPMSLFFCYILPTTIPVWYWGESKWNSFFIAGVLKYCYNLNITFLVNSAAHTFGSQPYNKYIMPRENAFVSFLVHGEGWHNYHHVFPWDYSTSELGYTLNLTKAFIDFMAWIGQAYDLKSAHPQMIKNRKVMTGDGSRMKQMGEKEQLFLCSQSYAP